MIHFDFTVTDLEAETIMSILHHEITRTFLKSMKAISDNDESLIAYNEEHIKCLESIFAKMNNTRIPEHG